MKTLLLIALIFCGLITSSQTVSSTLTTSQEALETFEKGWITLDYGSLKSEDKLNLIESWVGLKVLVAKENEANRLINEAATEAEKQAQIEKAAAERQAKIDYLITQGFKCDNSKEDWYLLYNQPKIFGANWRTQADYQISLSTGVDYFISIAYSLWQEILKNK